jgi:hypothetical protein
LNLDLANEREWQTKGNDNQAGGKGRCQTLVLQGSHWSKIFAECGAESVDCLELKGVIENVKYNEWVTRMIHVPKIDGKTLW